jgi:hypothetical protein
MLIPREMKHENILNFAQKTVHEGQSSVEQTRALTSNPAML